MQAAQAPDEDSSPHQQLPTTSSSRSSSSRNNNKYYDDDNWYPLYLEQLLHEFDTKPALTEDQLRWCEDVKQALAAQNDLKEISDFELAQVALNVPEGDIENALYRIKNLQAFREEYSIHDTVEEGMELLQGLTKLWPLCLLDVAYLPLSNVDGNSNDGNHNNTVEVGGHFTAVADYGHVNPDVLRMPEDWRILLGAMYYHNQLVNCHLRCVKEGVGYVVETQGMTLHNFSVDIGRQLWYHLFEFYPLKWKAVYYVHASVVGNLVHSFMKTLFDVNNNKPIANAIKVGCDLGFADSSIRLDEIFGMPTTEIAAARLLKTCHTYLLVRYQNQKGFRLRHP